MKLKIKDEKDLKELEKFGFRHEDETEKSVECWTYENRVRGFEICRVSVFDREVFCIDALHKIYDLTKADMVEKVEG